MQKPGKVQAIAIMTFVSGIVNILYGLSLGLGFLLGVIGTYGLSLCCAPMALLPIALGIFEIIGGAKLMGTPPRRFDVQTIAIFEISNIDSFAFPSLVVGILNLVFYNEPATRDYIDRLRK